MSNRMFAAIAFASALVLAGASQLIVNDYFFSAAYTVLQFIILATAWNILGGYTGYVTSARRRSLRWEPTARCSSTKRCTRRFRS